MPNFKLECFQNEFLALGAGDVNAVITLTASGGGPREAGGGAPGAVVLLIDVSGSMEGEKIRQARKATKAAIDCVPDGQRFAVVAGSDRPVPVYPDFGLAVASAESRQAAGREVDRLTAGGGTRISTWLGAARQLLAGQAGVRQAILLTDGKNENETSEQLEAALVEAATVFGCDCRGVGTDWAVAELRRIAETLMGSVDIIADPKHLTADFEKLMQQAMGKAVADVSLRVWVPQGATVTLFKQVAPTLLDLGATGTPAGQATDYPVGAWGDESRDYHLAVRVQPGGAGDEMLAARVSVLVDGEPAGQALARAIWTDDAELSTRINRQVAHYTGQAELAEAIQDGLEARAAGDDGTAVVKLGRAVQLAAESHNTEMSDLLAKVVDVDDPATGRVRLKKQVSAADAMTLDTRSSKTLRVHR